MHKAIFKRITLLLSLVVLCVATACTNQPATNTTNASASPSPSPSVTPTATSSTVPVTLPVLDALFSDESFKAKLKSSAQITDDQVAQLQKIASDEVRRLRQSNLEGETAGQTVETENSRQSAAQAIRQVVGDQKAEAVFSFVRHYWVNGGEEVAADENAPAAPNAVPKDTRIVVNIPAYRMDVFRDGAIVKSYKVGIGYPDFPLPTGLRKAQSIIINPTWTPPDEPWVAKMKGVQVGEKVEAGSKLNPLGPIKIPIGSPSLIHGGKSPAKLGTFASHGCVGLTTPQVQDFSKLLAEVGGSSLSDQKLQSYLKDKTKTQTVKLDRAVPVELRYETIVVEDGKLHIYRDVYANNTNTEENLHAVLSANGINFEDFTEAERTQVVDALNAMSATPKAAAAKPAATREANANSAKDSAKNTPKAKAIGKNQKEVVIDIAALRGKGYPVAVNLDTGSGKPAALMASAKPTDTGR